MLTSSALPKRAMNMVEMILFWGCQPGQISCECLEGPQVSYYSELANLRVQPGPQKKTQKKRPKIPFIGVPSVTLSRKSMIHQPWSKMLALKFQVRRRFFIHCCFRNQESRTFSCHAMSAMSFFMPIEPWKKTCYFPLYWLFNRDPYFMVYEIIPI